MKHASIRDRNPNGSAHASVTVVHHLHRQVNCHQHPAGHAWQNGGKMVIDTDEIVELRNHNNERTVNRSPLQPSERYDTRPRADRYTSAVVELVRLTEGEDAAHDARRRLEKSQSRAGISPLSRLDRPAMHMPGFPVIDLSPKCRAMAEAARNIDWFRNAGKELDSFDSTESAGTWKQARVRILSERWENYTIDALNAISEPIQERSQTVLNELSNEVEYTIERILTGDIRNQISNGLKVPQKWRDNVIDEVLVMIVGACREEHWSEFASLRHRPFLQLFELLQRGHLPCDALEPYPATHFMVL